MKFPDLLNPDTGIILNEFDTLLKNNQHLEKELSTEIPDYLKLAVSELQEYFYAKRTDFTFKLQPQGTEFQQKIWQELTQIPFGKTISYFELSKIIKSISKSKAQIFRPTLPQAKYCVCTT